MCKYRRLMCKSGWVFIKFPSISYPWSCGFSAQWKINGVHLQNRPKSSKMCDKWLKVGKNKKWVKNMYPVPVPQGFLIALHPLHIIILSLCTTITILFVDIW